MALPADRWGELSTLFAELIDLPAAERATRLRRRWRTLPSTLSLSPCSHPPTTSANGRAGGVDACGGAHQRWCQPWAVGLGSTSCSGRSVRAGWGRCTRRTAPTTNTQARRDQDGFALGDRTQALARFQRERQLLARLEHRNIAALLDGGVTPEGEPYFIMEYVEGQPIDQWSTAHHLGLRDRLALFRQVCAAVQYAHEHLVIHRDLKPGNILVAVDGTVKLLDFGIAKLADPTVLGGDDLTHTGVTPMTVAYASPEQLLGGEVTTASDIYSLGVVLYELVTGVRPFAPTARGAWSSAACRRRRAARSRPSRRSASRTRPPGCAVRSPATSTRSC
ncbi:MAG: serine/threonine protein kinase [Gemmatimonadetes bacterium]|nr:serine/threonine protein kinase [Gemmatimonadota bacterium]